MREKSNKGNTYFLSNGKLKVIHVIFQLKL